jgi:hypothetical protein
MNSKIAVGELLDFYDRQKRKSSDKHKTFENIIFAKNRYTRLCDNLLKYNEQNRKNLQTKIIIKSRLEYDRKNRITDVSCELIKDPNKKCPNKLKISNDKNTIILPNVLKSSAYIPYSNREPNLKEIKEIGRQSVDLKRKEYKRSQMPMYFPMQHQQAHQHLIMSLPTLNDSNTNSRSTIAAPSRMSFYSKQSQEISDKRPLNLTITNSKSSNENLDKPFSNLLIESNKVKKAKVINYIKRSYESKKLEPLRSNVEFPSISKFFPLQAPKSATRLTKEMSKSHESVLVASRTEFPVAIKYIDGATQEKNVPEYGDEVFVDATSPMLPVVMYDYERELTDFFLNDETRVRVSSPHVLNKSTPDNYRFIASSSSKIHSKNRIKYDS